MIGMTSGQGASAYDVNNNVFVGAYTGYSGLITGASNNTFIGYGAGKVVTSGANNILLGYQAGEALTTGTKNIVIGYDIDAPAVNSTNVLNIGNLIYATGLDGSGTTLSSGNVGIGTTSPWGLLSINANGLAVGAPQFVIGSSTRTDFIVTQNGNVGIGTSSPFAKLSITGTTAQTNPLLAIDYSLSGTATSSALYVSSLGNMGIGTTTPGRTLDVFGSGRYSADLTLGNSISTRSTAVSDTFTRANGAIGTAETGQTWTGSTATVSSNKAVITPTEGSDILTNAGFEAPYTGGLANGWALAEGTPTVTEETTIKYGGSSSQKFVTVVGGTGIKQASAPALTIGTWYSASVYVYPSTGNHFYSMIGWDGTAAMIAKNANLTSDQWSNIVGTGRAKNTGSYIRITESYAGSTNYLDDFTLKPLTLSSLFASLTYNGSTDLTVQTDATITSGTQAGVVMNLDSASSPANFVIAYHDGTNAHLEKAVAGVYTSLIDTAVAYSAGATIKIVKIGTTYQLFYNGSQVGADQTITDAGIISNTLHGLFSTYSGNTLDNFVISTQSSLAFTSGNNASIFSSAANTLNFTTAGLERMRITSNGNVGIGTTTPNQLFSLYSSAADAAVSLGNSNATMWTMGTDYSDGSKFKIASSSALGTNDRLTIDTNGNVGIGTTSPWGKLAVSQFNGGLSPLFTVASSTGSSATSTLFLINSNGNVGIGTTSPATKKLSINGGIYATEASIFGSDVQVYGALNVDGNFSVNTTYLTVDSATGNIYTAGGLGVGVSTTTAGVLETSGMGYFGGAIYAGGSFATAGSLSADGSLTVAGTATSTGNMGTGGHFYALGNISTNGVFYASAGSAALPSYAFGAATTTGIFTPAINQLAFSSNGVERVRINGNGNVGIGTTNPGYNLEVVGTGKISGVLTTDTVYGNISGILNLQANTSIINQIWLDNASGNVFTFKGSQSAREITSATTRQAWMSIEPNVNQSGTAAYDGLRINVTENAVGDGSTGDGNNLFNAAIGGVSKFVINRSGNVGIGTTSPWGKLAVSQFNGGLSPLFTVASSTGSSATSTLFLINSNGNVGIGTTTPGSLLDVYGDINVKAGSYYKYNGVNFAMASTTLHNNFFGQSAGNLTTTGLGSNTGVGYVSLSELTTGYYNTAVGAAAMQKVQSGSYNTAMGLNALRDNISGNYNTAIGVSALYVTTGAQNTALGSNALVRNTSGGYNTALGTFASQYGTGSYNTVVGDEAGNGIDGVSNYSNVTLLGYKAGYGLTTGDNQTFLGYQAGYTASSTLYNTFVGYQAGKGATGPTFGDGNTSLGYQALTANTSGYSNVAIGRSTLYGNTTGYENTALGSYALNAGSGNRNVAVGYDALRSNPGYLNVAIGHSSQTYSTSGNLNTTLGAYSLQQNVTGTSNTVIGYMAGMGVSNSSNITGNSLFGVNAGFGLLTGADNNTLLGYSAGSNITTGASNIIIGASVNAPSATASNQLNIGNTIYGNLSTGNVGIGTTGPASPLHIYSTVASYLGGITVQQADTSSTLRLWLDGANNNAHISRGTTEAIVINGTGLVGIGTTNPAQLLSLSSSNTIGTGVNIINTDTGGYSWNIFSAGSAGTVGSAGSLVFRDSTNSISRMVIKNDGNVGIGTTSPQTLLHLGGTTGILRIDGPTGYYGTINDGGGFFNLAAVGSGTVMTFSTGGTEKMRLGINGLAVGSGYVATEAPAGGMIIQGNVGIGTTSPWSALAVEGTITQTNQKSCANGLTTDANGAINGCAASDVSLKTDIIPETYDALSIIDLLAPVSYKWRNPSVKDALTHSGFIAQSVEAVFPTAITGGGFDEFGNAMKAVDPNAIGSLLARGVQELNAKTEALGSGFHITNSERVVIFSGSRAMEALPNREISLSAENILLNGEVTIGYNPTQPPLNLRGGEGGVNIFNVASSSGESFFAIDSLGSIGIGTSTPAIDSGIRVAIGGDVGATGFVNLSARETKKDIEYLGSSDYEAVLDKISKDVKPATYEYNSDADCLPSADDGLRTAVGGSRSAVACSRRLGLIADEAPLEVLSADGKGVDLYKLATFTLMGVKGLVTEVDAVKIKVDSLESRLAALESNVGMGGQIGFDQALETLGGEPIILAPSSIAALSNGLYSSILAKFESLGVIIGQGVAKFQNLMADVLQVNQVAINIAPQTDANGVTKDPTIGSAQINAGELTAYIINNQISSTTKIFLTPDQPISLGVCEQNEQVISLPGGGTRSPGFMVCMSATTSQIVKFSWWIIGVVNNAERPATSLDESRRAEVEPALGAQSQGDSGTATETSGNIGSETPAPIISPEVTPAVTPEVSPSVLPAETPASTPSVTPSISSEAAPTPSEIPVVSETPTP
jgi:hypothetical protein